MDGKLAVQLMDYGDIEFVCHEKLRALNSVSVTLAQLPPQAIRVALSRVPPSPTKTFKPEAAKKLREMAPPDCRCVITRFFTGLLFLLIIINVILIFSLIMRCVGMQAQNNGQLIPVVEIFERMPSGLMAMINATIEMDESLYCTISTTDTKSPPVAVENGNGPDLLLSMEGLKLRKSSTSSSGLASSGVGSKSSSPSPTFSSNVAVVPEAEMPVLDSRSFFDVKVCNVSSPSHFYVQPLPTAFALTELTRRLKVRWKMIVIFP